MSGEEPAAETKRRRSRSTSVSNWAIGIVVAALGAFITTQLIGLLTEGKEKVFPETPLTVSATNPISCPSVYPVSPQEIQRAIDAEPARIDYRRIGAIDGDQSRVELTIQAKPGKTIVVNSIRVVVDERAAPHGVRTSGCGAAQPPRYFTADLDDPSGVAVPDTETRPDGPTPDFPYRVANDDPEVFRLVASTKTCDCRWHVELDWTVDGRRGTTPIDDSGKPFRTIAATGQPLRDGYLNNAARRFELLPGN